jgi:hypothetical protein
VFGVVIIWGIRWMVGSKMNTQKESLSEKILRYDDKHLPLPQTLENVPTEERVENCYYEESQGMERRENLC